MRCAMCGGVLAGAYLFCSSPLHIALLSAFAYRYPIACVSISYPSHNYLSVYPIVLLRVILLVILLVMH